MKKKMISLIIALIILFASSVLLIILAVLSGCHKNDSLYLLQKKDINDCDIYINNITCEKINETRSVKDEEFSKKIATMCTKAKKYRPVITSDYIIGEPDAYIIFEKESVRYMISFFDVEKQLNLDYIYRNEPLINVDRYSLDQENNPSLDWGWYCTLSACDFATLYEMVFTYTEGDIIIE